MTGDGAVGSGQQWDDLDDNLVQLLLVTPETVDYDACWYKFNCMVTEGRASGSPTMDLFMTLLSLGRAGYRKLLADRKAMYHYLQQQLALCAERHGQKLLRTKNNPISIGEFYEVNFIYIF